MLARRAKKRQNGIWIGEVQQSAASGVAPAELRSRFGFKRAAGGGSRYDGPDSTIQWNDGHGGVMGHHPQDFDAELSREVAAVRGSGYLRDDFCSLLSQAITGLDQDSYATRGAVYDRECKSLMRRLYSANPPLSDAEIDAELRAFRNAVRIVEFGPDEQDVLVLENDGLAGRNNGRQDRTGLLQRDHNIHPNEPDEFRPVPQDVGPLGSAHGRNLSGGRSGELSRRMLRDPPPWAQRQPVQIVPSERIESALEAALNLGAVEPPSDGDFDQAETDVSGTLPEKRKSISRRLVPRALLAVALLAVGTAGYAVLTGDLDLPFLDEFANGSSTQTLLNDQAILFDGQRPDLNGSKFEGKVHWQLRTEKSGAESVPVIQLDLNVPGRRMSAIVVLRREPAGSSMSHIFEIRFIGDDRQPDPDIANISGVIMVNPDLNVPNSLVGRVVIVTPGVFMFGLSGLPNDREQNLRKLVEFPWIAIPVTYRNGTAGVLTFEKGDEGIKVFNKALDLWASAT